MLSEQRPTPNLEELRNIRVRLYINERERSRLEALAGEFLFGTFVGPSKLKWVGPQDPADISLFVDSEIHPKTIARDTCKTKVGILLEPLSVHPGIRAATLISLDFLDLVLTYDKGLLGTNSKFKSYWVGATLLQANESLTSLVKTDLISMTLSKKKYMPGHKLRHQIAPWIQQHYLDAPTEPILQLMGGAYKPYTSPLEPYARFRFSIVVENEQNPLYFTEKLVECLIAKCVPIYWGASNIGDLFDKTGILAFSSPSECLSIVKSATAELYESLEDSILRNQEAAYDLLSKDLNIQRAIAGEVIPAKYGTLRMEDFTKTRVEFLSGNAPILPKTPALKTQDQITPAPIIPPVFTVISERIRNAWKSKIRFRSTVFITRVLRGIRVIKGAPARRRG